jgi:hypothetical protein
MMQVEEEDAGRLMRRMKLTDRGGGRGGQIEEE